MLVSLEVHKLVVIDKFLPYDKRIQNVNTYCLLVCCLCYMWVIDTFEFIVLKLLGVPDEGIFESVDEYTFMLTHILIPSHLQLSTKRMY